MKARKISEDMYEIFGEAKVRTIDGQELTVEASMGTVSYSILQSEVQSRLEIIEAIESLNRE